LISQIRRGIGVSYADANHLRVVGVVKRKQTALLKLVDFEGDGWWKLLPLLTVVKRKSLLMTASTQAEQIKFY
jgi:hypothetical protein